MKRQHRSFRRAMAVVDRDLRIEIDLREVMLDLDPGFVARRWIEELAV